MSLADRLRKQMRWRGIHSQSQLARISGVPQASIHRILMRSGYAPRTDTLKRLAAALDTTTAWLAEGLVGTLTPADLPHDPSPAEAAEADGYQRELLALTAPLDLAAKRRVVSVVRMLVHGVSTPPADQGDAEAGAEPLTHAAAPPRAPAGPARH